MDIALAVVTAVLAWWFGTGVILWLDRQDRPWLQLAIGLWSVLALLALYGAHRSMNSTTPGHAYLGFASALVMWGWHELLFLSGWLTGPRKIALSPNAQGWRRFVQASAAVLWHEVSLAINALVLIALQVDSPNPMAWYTFALLWCLRLGAKFNLFAGVPWVGAQFLPPHLTYMASYFKVSPPGWCYRLTLSLALLAWIGLVLHTSTVAPEDITRWVLLCTLLGLGILEMALMVLPWSLQQLWGWMVRLPDPT